MLGAGDQEREIETWSQPRSGPECLKCGSRQRMDSRVPAQSAPDSSSSNDYSLFVCFFPLVPPLA